MHCGLKESLIIGVLYRDMFEMLQNKTGKKWILIGLGFLVCFLFLFRLGSEAFMDYDEADYAKISVESIQTHHYLTLTIEGENWFDKPPLQFWAGEFFLKSGLRPEWAFRLPGALTGIISVFLVGLIVYEISLSFSAGILASLILATTGAFLMTAREFKLDVPVTMFFLLGVYSFLKGKKNSRWYLGIGIALGLAVMTKSIIGILLIPIILSFILAFTVSSYLVPRVLSEVTWYPGHQVAGWLKNKWFWIGNLLGLIIALPWHIYEWVRFGYQFFQSYVLFNIFSRYSNDILNQHETVALYFTTLWKFAMPWFVVFLLTGIFTILFWKKINTSIQSGILGSWVSVLGLFILFSISKTKIPYYLVPLYPFIAIAIALSYKWLIDISQSRIVKQSIIVVIFLLILWSSWSSIQIGYHLNPHFNIEHRFAEEEKQIGLLLKDKVTQTVYFDTELYTETVRFYSGKYVDVLDRNNIPTKPFYEVLFLERAYNDAFYNKLLKTAEPLYKGEFYGLYRVE